MKTHFSALAAAVALLTASAAQADQTWQFDHMSLSNIYPSDSQVTLVSQSANATVISLTSYAAVTKAFAVEAHAGISSDWVPESAMMDFGYGDFGVTVADGYRITGITFDLDIKGDLRPGLPNGETHNAMQSTVQVRADGLLAQGPRIDDLNGTTQQSIALSGLNFADPFELNVQSYIYNYAAAAYSYHAESGTFYSIDNSYAGIWAENATLTFHMAPVPEPAAYLMLGTGLAAMAGLARRRRKLTR